MATTVDTAASTALAGQAGAGTSRAPRESQAQSKRDKKRQLLNERLAALTEKFERDRDMTYRDQLQRIQVDTRLVQRIDPYSDSAPDLIAELRQEHRAIPGQNTVAGNARTLFDMAGPGFQEWAQAVSDLHERKDFQLTRQYHEYERKRQEYKNTYNYRVETARREHQALASTLRDRLINSLASKKNRLNKEKEALELSDSSALLFHPNQFSITNPASPGPHGKRATRLRRDAEDSMGIENKKRKRNAADEDGSPAPGRRGIDSAGTTPFWQSEKLRVAAKQNGPVYSIDKLFTDKELTMTYNTAALAAHQHVLRHHVGDGGGGGASSPDGSDDDRDGEGEDGFEAPMMERAPSHATRSTRGAANQNVIDHRVLGYEAIADFEVPGNLEKLQSLEVPKMPPAAPSQYLKPTVRAQDQTTPSLLATDAASSDLQIMGYFKQFDQQYKQGSALNLNSSLRRVLESASVPRSVGRFVGYVGGPRHDPEEIRRDLGLPPGAAAAAAANANAAEHPSPEKLGAAGASAAAVAMSRQSSQGGVAMSRQGTNGSGRGKGRKTT